MLRLITLLALVGFVTSEDIANVEGFYERTGLRLSDITNIETSAKEFASVNMPNPDEKTRYVHPEIGEYYDTVVLHLKENMAALGDDARNFIYGIIDRNANRDSYPRYSQERVEIAYATLRSYQTLSAEAKGEFREEFFFTEGCYESLANTLNEKGIMF